MFVVTRAVRSLCSQGLVAVARTTLSGGVAGAASPVRAMSTIVLTKDLERAQKSQEVSLMENCILVDENDQPTGYASKRDCHRVGDNNSLLLHRAFSVFLFNTQGEMLVQRRSSHKVTFPDLYTNACCSHPLHDFPGEVEMADGIGVKRAAQRRLNVELGIPAEQCQPEEFHYLTRMLYADRGDGVWGEYELDYILFLIKDVEINPNPDEVREIRYIKRNELDRLLCKYNENGGVTPWFKIISEVFLKKWWDNLDNLQSMQDHKTIHRF